MAASDSAPPRSGTPSYTMIGEKDLEAIGAHCHYTYCNQLDFLPFRCESCKYTYCLDHRTEDAHHCPKAGAWAAARRKANTLPSTASNQALSQKPTVTTSQQCSSPSCKTFVNTGTSLGVTCGTCNRTYCLKHRMAEDHSCSTLKPFGARATAGPSSAQKAQNALARLRAWGKEKTAAAATTAQKKTRSSNTAGQVLVLNKLKQNAKGDAKVPPEKRLYLYVEAEAETTTSKFPRGEFFYSSEWSIGRMLDEAARALQVENMNNRGGGEEERLRVFHVEGGKVLEFGEKVGKTFINGNTAVLLRGIGPAVPNLVQA